MKSPKDRVYRMSVAYALDGLIISYRGWHRGYKDIWKEAKLTYFGKLVAEKSKEEPVLIFASRYSNNVLDLGDWLMAHGFRNFAIVMPSRREYGKLDEESIAKFKARMINRHRISVYYESNYREYRIIRKRVSGCRVYWVPKPNQVIAVL